MCMSSSGLAASSSAELEQHRRSSSVRPGTVTTASMVPPVLWLDSDRLRVRAYLLVRSVDVRIPQGVEVRPPGVAGAGVEVIVSGGRGCKSVSLAGCRACMWSCAQLLALAPRRLFLLRK